MVWQSLTGKEAPSVLLFRSSTFGIEYLIHSHCDHLCSGSEIAFSHSQTGTQEARLTFHSDWNTKENTSFLNAFSSSINRSTE